eukprot:128215-Rhodomonas_salina.1
MKGSRNSWYKPPPVLQFSTRKDIRQYQDSLLPVLLVVARKNGSRNSWYTLPPVRPFSTRKRIRQYEGSTAWYYSDVAA